MCSPFLYSKSQMDKAVSDALDSTRKELKAVRGNYEKDMDWYKDKTDKLNAELEDLREKVRDYKICTEHETPVDTLIQSRNELFAAMEKQAIVPK